MNPIKIDCGTVLDGWRQTTMVRKTGKAEITEAQISDAIGNAAQKTAMMKALSGVKESEIDPESIDYESFLIGESLTGFPLMVGQLSHQAELMAWFKVNRPLIFYTAVFAVDHCPDLDYRILMEGKNRICLELDELHQRSLSEGATQEDRDRKFEILSLALECEDRGIHLPDSLFQGYVPNAKDPRLTFETGRIPESFDNKPFFEEPEYQCIWKEAEAVKTSERIKEKKSSDKRYEIANKGSFKQIDENNALRTGIRQIDEKGCSFRPGGLYLLAGRPAMGKKETMMQMASSIAKEKPVYIFSMDRTAEALAGCRHTENLPSISNIFCNDMITELKEMEKLSRERITDGILFISNLQMIDSELFPDPDKGDQNPAWYTGFTRQCRDRKNYSDIIKRLKRLAGELNIPIVLLSNLSRQLESRADKHPQLKDTWLTEESLETLDGVILLYREGYYTEGMVTKCVHRSWYSMSVSKKSNGGEC